MSTALKTGWTPEAYLAFERAREVKHEYVNGEVYLMAGASAKHNVIVGSTVATLHAQLRQRPYELYLINMRVKVSTTVYSYPDVTIVCEPPRFEDDHEDTLLNPTLIVEVLSPSTEGYDRGKKFTQYRELDSLREYVLIAQDSRHIERYLRQPDGQWLLTDAKGADGVLELASIGCVLSLADVYEKVEIGT